MDSDRRNGLVRCVFDVRSGRAERLRWCSCLALNGAVEASVRVEEIRMAAEAVEAQRRIALEGAIVRCVYVVVETIWVIEGLVVAARRRRWSWIPSMRYWSA